MALNLRPPGEEIPYWNCELSPEWRIHNTTGVGPSLRQYLQRSCNSNKAHRQMCNKFYKTSTEHQQGKKNTNKLAV